MNATRLPMPQPPDAPENPSAFAKLGGKSTRVAPASRRRDHNDAYDEEQARRGNWLLLTIVATLLAIGALLIFSGLL
ncbi:MAG: hypothetical protein HZA93_29005 [Verrucomicrobia bacterium]|nr:hypothetical protein [Verrucomicrobiota bacterium]